MLERRAALRAQRELLVERIRETEGVVRALDRVLDAMDGETIMETDDVFEGLGEIDHMQHAREAEERWGDTDAYRESMRRMKSYTKDDWARMKVEGEVNEAAMAALLEAGAAPADEEARAVAERMRRHIADWFYPCSHEMHGWLADMYLSDPRFRAHYDDRAAGLAAFVSAAIHANGAAAAGSG